MPAAQGRMWVPVLKKPGGSVLRMIIKSCA